MVTNTVDRNGVAQACGGRQDYMGDRVRSKRTRHSKTHAVPPLRGSTRAELAMSPEPGARYTDWEP